MTNFTAFADWAISNAEFDADWYRTTFPDVAMLRMDPEEHFRLYGALMGRAPNAALAAAPAQMTELVGKARARRSDSNDAAEKAAALKLPAPRKGGELLAAHEIAQTGNHARAIHYAKQHLPPEFAHTLHVLEANRAVAEGDESRWLRHLNAYLGTFGVAPLRLTDEPLPLLDRFTTDCTPQSVDGPLVSVIMPAWNAETTIRAAARSILNQTWRNLELLIVDDASDDGTWRIMQELAASDTRVRIRRNKVNVGPYVSKNIALTEAKGEWITGHDADDWAHPERLERHLATVLTSPTPVHASRPKMIKLMPHGIARIYARARFSQDGCSTHCAIATIYKTSFLRKVLGYWDSVRIGADAEMISRAMIALGTEFKEVHQMSMIGLDLTSSLTNHAVWGAVTSKNKNGVRAQYRKAWLAAHKSYSSADCLYMEFPSTQPKFQTPKEITITPAVISKVLSRNYNKKPKRLKRIIYIVPDASTIGGMQGRTRRTIDNQAARPVEYISISHSHKNKLEGRHYHSIKDDRGRIDDILGDDNTDDTVIVISNNSAKALDADIKSSVMKFPIIYWAAGQLAFMIQDSTVMNDKTYTEWLRVSRIVSVSRMDIDFQRQLGIFGQVKGFPPVDERAENTYEVTKNRLLTYIGRIDFHTKDCEKLIDLAIALKRRKGAPLRIFTTDNPKNSPNYKELINLAEQQNVIEYLDINLNITDKEAMYSDTSILYLPSKKEAIGNVILEAFSFGVPVIAASYAPGPAELIEHEVNGLLFDDLTNSDDILDAIEAIDKKKLLSMSNNAFQKHRDYSLDRYYDFMESLGQQVLNEFNGANTLPVFPRLKILERQR